jgi:signal transduction histidine kinase
LGVGGLALGAAHRANRKRLAELERQRAIERDRTRIAHDLHDDIGAGLTQLTLLTHSARLMVAGSDKAATRLDEMRGAIHRMTESLDEIVWAVNPHNDSLDSLVTYLGKFIQDFLHRGGVSCKLDFPFELEHLEMPAEVRHALYLAVREALHNILRHSGATEVRVSLSSETDDVLFLIEDNGRGFRSTDTNSTAPEAAPRFSQGLGLQSMTQRMRDIGGECTYGNRPEGGAFVRFRLRLGPEADVH